MTSIFFVSQETKFPGERKKFGWAWGLSRVAIFGLATGGNRNQGSTKFNRWCQRLYRGERPSVCIGAWSHGFAYFSRAHQCQRVGKAKQIAQLIDPLLGVCTASLVTTCYIPSIGKSCQFYLLTTSYWAHSSPSLPSSP